MFLWLEVNEKGVYIIYERCVLVGYLVGFFGGVVV